MNEKDKWRMYQLRTKVQMSKTLDVGPMKIMKRAIDQAFHAFGVVRYSGSTLSLFIFYS